MKVSIIIPVLNPTSRLVTLTNELIELGYDPTQEVEQVMDSAEKRIFEVMQKKNQKGYSSIKDILVDTFTQLEQLYNQKQHITGVPTGFADLIPVMALYRPGPLGSGMVTDFINGRHGRKKVTYIHPDLEPILKETFGVILYQEQVMQIVQVLAGFTLGQADILRRAMGKKKHDVLMSQKENFLKGAKDNGVDDKLAETI